MGKIEVLEGRLRSFEGSDVTAMLVNIKTIKQLLAVVRAAKQMNKARTTCEEEAAHEEIDSTLAALEGGE